MGGAGGCHVQPDQCIHSILCPVNTEGMKMDRKGRILNMAKGAVHVGTGRLLLNFHLEYECANLRVPLFLRAASDIVVKYSTFVRLMRLSSAHSFPFPPVQMRQDTYCRGTLYLHGFSVVCLVRPVAGPVLIYSVAAGVTLYPFALGGGNELNFV